MEFKFTCWPLNDLKTPKTSPNSKVMEPSFNSVASGLKWNHWCPRPPCCMSICRGAIDHSQEFAKWRRFNKMRFGLVYWLEIVHSSLVREIILCSSMLRILFLVQDLPLQNSKKN